MITKFLKDNQHEITTAWLEAQLDNPYLRLHQLESDDLREQSISLIEQVIALLQIEDLDLDDTTTPEYEALHLMLTNLSTKRGDLGLTGSETASYIFSLREFLLDYLRQHLTGQAEVLGGEITRISRLVDRIGLMVFEIFIAQSQQIISRQRQEILELATPVVHLWDGILAVPLIGTLDSSRAQHVMENLLHEIADTGFEVVVLDISGVSTVDTLVAQYLLRTVSAARLMGADCIISGISPAIAQTIVHLGLDLSSVRTTATLAGALKLAFTTLGLRVRRLQDKRSTSRSSRDQDYGA